MRIVVKVGTSTLTHATGRMDIRHVETQLPYATLVAAVCTVGYLIAGFTLSPWIALVVQVVLLVAAVLILHRSNWRAEEGAENA